MKTELISARLEKEDTKILEEITKEENTDKTSALKKIDELVLSNHLRTCVADSIRSGDSDAAIKEVMEVFEKK